ncbi:hypothetical protein GCM10012280_45150 [Wenjunlia tyrosinilytica]|uniref:Uncharacterized protein n=1 Tax=Wenjunlia tyrosinilytica TaxID=1544741 RepID=A0A918DYT1_9ACTN|nr:hypothetical protein GCM10012280_45150 [Wenjunlia tyrosinilytica]
MSQTDPEPRPAHQDRPGDPRRAGRGPVLGRCRRAHFGRVRPRCGTAAGPDASDTTPVTITFWQAFKDDREVGAVNDVLVFLATHGSSRACAIAAVEALPGRPYRPGLRH